MMRNVERKRKKRIGLCIGLFFSRRASEGCPMGWIENKTWDPDEQSKQEKFVILPFSSFFLSSHFFGD